MSESTTTEKIEEVNKEENPPKDEKDQEMKTEEEKQDDSDKQNNVSTEEVSKASDTESKDSDKKSQPDIQNDGVKILEEVFGKATVDEKEDTQSNKPNESVSFGPMPPTEKEYDEEELKKAEEHKCNGNKAFAGKYCIFISSPI